MHNTSILIVDDHALLRETWAFFLSRENGFDVIGETGDGHKAIDIAARKRPAIVLLDINMSPIDGFETIKGILKVSPASKVLAVSMHSEFAYAKKMLGLGACGYVSKNSTIEEMTEAIHQMMNGQIYVCREIKDALTMQVMGVGEQKVDLHVLSARESEVAGHICAGLSSKEIAETMGLSIKTIEVHRGSILKKLNVRNVASLMNIMNAARL